MTSLPKLPHNRSAETFDSEKFNAILIKNWPWILLIIFSSNLSAYLFLRWTKDTFKSESEIKLDIKSKASDFGFDNVLQKENSIDVLSGEIEQIRSQVFLHQVVDSLDLNVSYYSKGKVLDDEMYRRSPYAVHFDNAGITLYNQPVYFKFSNTGFALRVNKDELEIPGKFNQPLEVSGMKLTIRENPQGVRNDDNAYYFIINTPQSVLSFLSKNLTVEPINFNAKTIRISFKDYNALKTKVIVSTIDSLYLHYSNQQKNLASTQKIQWLNNELLDIESKMGSYERYFEAFTIKNKSSDLTADLKNVIAQINRIDSQRYVQNRQIQELNQLIDNVTKNNNRNQSLNSALPASVVRKIETLAEKKVILDKLGLTYSDNTFAYKQKEREYTALKDEIFNDLLDVRKALVNRLTESENRKKSLENTFASLPDKNTQYSKNQRYYKLYEQFYLTLMQSKAEFEVAQAGSTPDFKILSPAVIPTVPIAPKRNAILSVGFVAGLAISFFFIGFSYLLNNKITSVKEIESSLDIPVLGMLPANPAAAKTPFFIVESPRSRLSESIRNLRSNLDFVTAKQERKILAVSSTISGEGKSFLAQNLAAVLALTKKKVVLLDLDLRKPKKNLPFQLPGQDKGISTILIQKENWRDCLVDTHIEGLHYLPNGPIPPNPAELLMNGEFDSLLQELKAEYDFIVLDTPPAGLVTDGVMAMKRADLALYVFRCNYSRKENLRTLNRLIKINKINKLAIVFNDFIPPTDNGYGYYVEEKRKKRFFNLI